jgi:hypothetical protein
VTCWNSIVEINFSVHKESHATMKKDTVVPLRQPEGKDLLSTMLREGAQRLIAEALQAEFATVVRAGADWSKRTRAEAVSGD